MIAIRLVLWNLGGGFPGEPCKTTQGHPGYYTFCIADDAEANPWEPLEGAGCQGPLPGNWMETGSQSRRG